MESNVENFVELRNASVKPANITMSNVAPSDEIADIVDMNSANLIDAYLAIREVNTDSTVLKAMIQDFLQSEKYSSIDTVADDILYELEDMLQELRYDIENAVLEIKSENNKSNNLN